MVGDADGGRNIAHGAEREHGEGGVVGCGVEFGVREVTVLGGNVVYLATGRRGQGEEGTKQDQEVKYLRYSGNPPRHRGPVRQPIRGARENGDLSVPQFSWDRTVLIYSS